MTCFPPCLLSFLSHHNHHHDILKNTKKQRHFFKKKKIGKKNKKKKNAKSQFWLRITRKVDATGPDFGCKFRLRRSPGASESVFGPITAPCLTFFYFFFIFVCVAYLWRSLNTARFSDNSHFFVVTLSGGFCKNAFFHVFDEKCALRTYSVSMAFGDFRTQNPPTPFSGVQGV